jgi:hypothetical protein
MQETRFMFIKRALRQIYNDQPSDDSNITTNLVNNWLGDAIGAAAKKNYTDNLQMDGVAYVNNSFYTTFSGLAIISVDQFTYQMTLPQIPFALGNNEGVGVLQFVDNAGNISDPAIPLSENQVGYFRNLRPIPNKILYFSEGIFLYAISTLQLNNFTGKVRIVSGGDNTNLNSILNVPDDFKPIMIEYIKNQLAWERAQNRISTNDGSDA